MHIEMCSHIQICLLRREASHYLLPAYLSDCRAEVFILIWQQVLQIIPFKSESEISSSCLVSLSQRKWNHQLHLEWPGPVTFLPIYRSNLGGTRKGGWGDEEQLKKQQTRWPQRETNFVDSLLWPPPISSSFSSLRRIDLPHSPPCEQFMAPGLLLCSFPGF